MFSKVWLARAPASHWLSPSVSMPTRRCMLPVLIRVAQRHVPAARVLVEVGRHLRTIDLRDELHRRLDLEVARALEGPPERGVHGERADLVRVFLHGFTIDPVQQRRDAVF